MSLGIPGRSGRPPGVPRIPRRRRGRGWGWAAEKGMELLGRTSDGTSRLTSQIAMRARQSARAIGARGLFGSGRTTGRVWIVAAFVAVGLALVGGPAGATSMRFSSSPRFGFVPEDLAGLPQLRMVAGDAFLAAADPIAPDLPPDLAVELTGTSNLCVLAQGSSTCRVDAAGIATPYSAIMSFEVNVLDPLLGSDPFTLMLTGVGEMDDPDLIRIALDPTLPVGLNTSAVPDFVFDPSNGVGGFDVPIAVRDEIDAASGAIYYHLGFTVQDGDRVTLRIDVDAAASVQPVPQLFANATPVVVPEPGTALLMGLGLVGLSWAGRRRS